MNQAFTVNALVHDSERIYQVKSAVEIGGEVLYSLKFLSYFKMTNYNAPAEDYQKTFQLKERELSVFAGSAPKFMYGDYVSTSKFPSATMSKIFFALYDGSRYSYFVQEHAQENIYDGMKSWVEEEYIKKL